MKKGVIIIANVFLILLLATLLILPSLSALDLEEQSDKAKTDLENVTNYAKSSFNFQSDIQLPGYIEKFARIIFRIEGDISLSALIILLVLFIFVSFISFKFITLNLLPKNYCILLSLFFTIIISYLGLISKITLLINWIIIKIPLLNNTDNSSWGIAIRLLKTAIIVIIILFCISLINEYIISPIKKWLEVKKAAREGAETGRAKKDIKSIITEAREVEEGYETAKS